MNFLAHAYLSGSTPSEHEEILVGNMIADFVKGKAILTYSPGIQKGIVLHRNIDLFTDTHPLVKECRKIFYPAIRHYAMVIVDVMFDHFLAKEWKRYHTLPLRDFTQQTYHTLSKHYESFPEIFQFVFTRMKAHDWLAGYATEQGLFNSFQGLSRRSPGFVFADETAAVFLQHKTELEDLFHRFFPELVAHCKA